MMKKIISLTLVLVMLFATVLALSACHGRSVLPTFEMPDEFDETKQYSITFWAKNDNNKYQQAIYRDAVARFEALYPNIDVTLRLFSDYNEIYRQVITNIPTHTTPNVCITYPDHVATYNTGDNVIIELDALMNDEAWGLGSDLLKFDAPTKDEIVDKFLLEGVIDGSQYALPFMRSTEACYINADMVKSLGFDIPEKLTWDFVFKVSEAAMALGKKTVTKVNEKTGEEYETEVYVANGQEILFPFIYKSTDNMMIQMLKQLGADYSTDDGEILLFNDTTKEIVYTVAEHTATGAFDIFAVRSYPGDYLNRGQCIFAIDSTAGATWMGPDAPNTEGAKDELIDFDLRVTAIPQFDTENPKMISQGPSICIFNKVDAGEVMAAWIFSQFLLTNDVQIEYSTTEGYVPVTKKAQTDPEYLDYLSRKGEEHPDKYYQAAKIEAAELLLNNIDSTFVTPVFNGSTSLRNAAGYLIENTVRSVQRKQKIDDAFYDKLVTSTSKLYRLDQIGSGPMTELELGAMPVESIVLLATVGAFWIGITAYVITIVIKKRKKS